VKYAAKLDYPLDMSPLAASTIAPLRDYVKMQRYSKNLPGDYAAQQAAGWVAKNKSIDNADAFIDQLPNKLLSIERPYVILLELPASDAANPVMPAHRDYNKTCGINVYLEANGEVTKFYNWDRDKQQSEYVEEFCAAPGEVWVMDTDTPHSVTLTPNKARRMLSFCFIKMKYTEVLECFQTT
jgi:hypothetical protein